MVGLAGVFPVLLGVVLVITQGAGALAITWGIGWYALAFGATQLTLAWEVRHEAECRRAPGAAAAVTGTTHPAT